MELGKERFGRFLPDTHRQSDTALLRLASYTFDEDTHKAPTISVSDGRRPTLTSESWLSETAASRSLHAGGWALHWGFFGDLNHSEETL